MNTHDIDRLLISVNIINASAADLRVAGTNPHAIPIPDEDDHGGYMASLEIIHHMRCLSFLRKVSFADYGYHKNDPVFEDLVFPLDYRLSKLAVHIST